MCLTEEITVSIGWRQPRMAFAMSPNIIRDLSFNRPGERTSAIPASPVALPILTAAPSPSMSSEYQTIPLSQNQNAAKVHHPKAWLFVLAVGCCVGCSEDSEITKYVVPAESERIFLTEVLAEQFPLIPFEWNEPEDWTSAELDQFSKVAWKAGSASDSGRVTVSNVNLAMGIDPQLTRWRRQIGVEEPEGNANEGAETLDVDGTAATYIDLQGKTESIVGMILPVDGELWVFKYRGTNTMAGAEKKRFRTFCESVRQATTAQNAEEP